MSNPPTPVTVTSTNPNLLRLREKLREMFQMDRGDLDFGIYRIMNQKRAEVERFLDEDLLPQVRTAFEAYQPDSSSTIQAQLDEAIRNATNLGIDPETSPKVQELRAQLATGVDLTALENEVYSHLHTFFARYYDDGDFLSLRRYKAGVYALPYEGEEVKLHWANHDQYYIKTAENLSTYAFKLESGRRVRFELVKAGTDQGNVKPERGKERRFILFADEPLQLDGGELVIRFEYRPDDEGRKQDPINAETVEALFAAGGGEAFADWLTALQAPAPTEKKPDRTVFEKHLVTYTAKNQFDYFIHKNLGGFLRRELDFFIKNEVMYLDDIEEDTVPRVEQYLSKIKVIRRIAHKVIDFLAQLEDFQKRLWLKKKFVLETQWCITLDRVPEELYPQIAANEAQRQEWVELFAINEITGDLSGSVAYSEPLTAEFLKANQGLVLDTKHFEAGLRQSILEAISDFQDGFRGLLAHGENSQANRLFSAFLKDQLNSIYIDPPYNTGDDGFPYKDGYQSSSWISMMLERLQTSRILLSHTGVIIVSISREELFNLEKIMNIAFGSTNRIAELVWEKGRKNDAKFVSIGHEYMLIYGKSFQNLKDNDTIWREEKPGAAEILTEYRRLKEQHGPDLAAIQSGIREFYGQLSKGHPSLKHRRFNRVDHQGIWRDHDISWPGPGGPRYDIPHPETGRPCKVPDSGWRFANKEKFDLYDDHGFIEYRTDHSEPPILKRYLNYVSTAFDPDASRSSPNGNNEDESNVQVMPSVFYKSSQPTVKSLRHLTGEDFPNPKDPEIVARVAGLNLINDGWFGDFFAGSGTSFEAACHIARAKKILIKTYIVEASEYFDHIILKRSKRLMHSAIWNDEKPQDREFLSGHLQYVRLESYEDALDNLSVNLPSGPQADLLAAKPEVREDYTLRYMLDVETKGSPSLLDLKQFDDPWSYTLKITRNDETRDQTVDLVETFNYLLGLRVRTRSRVRNVLMITGELPDGDKVLVLWRRLAEVDNDTLDTWFDRLDISTRDQEFAAIYVNGDSNLENQRRQDETWKVRLIEAEFHRLMFDAADA